MTAIRGFGCRELVSFSARQKLVGTLRHVQAVARIQRNFHVGRPASSAVGKRQPSIKNDQLQGPVSISTTSWRKIIASETLKLSGESNSRQAKQSSQGDDLLIELERQTKLAEQRLRHSFRDKRLIHTCLLHPSSPLWESHASAKSSQVLAWLGDSLLFVFTTDRLLRTYPDSLVFDYNSARRILIDRKTLANACKGLGIGKLLITGPLLGKYHPGPGVYGEMLEACLGAIYLDQGIAKVRKFYNEAFQLPTTISEISLTKRFCRGNFKLTRPPMSLPEELLQTLENPKVQAWKDSIDKDSFHRAVGYTFADARYMVPILIHGSIGEDISINTSKECADMLRLSEKLLFLGDAVILHALTEYLAGTFPTSSMADLNETRSRMNARNMTTGRVAEQMGLQNFVIAGHSMPPKNLQASHRLMSDFLCRLTGAIYLERGLKTACQFIIEPICREYYSSANSCQTTLKLLNMV